MSVYFITCRALHVVKIGYSDNPIGRMVKVQSDCPLPLVLEAVMDGTTETEAGLHARFSEQRVRGEWFHISPALDAVIAGSPFVKPAPVKAIIPESLDCPTDDELFAAFRSAADLARQLDAPITTVHSWKTKGIPAWRRAAIVALVRIAA